MGTWIVKGLALLFAIALVFASWPLWLGMLLITTVVAAVLARSLANGGWAVTVNERLGGRAHLLAPGVAILIAAIVVFAAGFGGSGTANKILLSIVLMGSGIGCWHVAGWVFGFVMRRAARRPGSGGSTPEVGSSEPPGFPRKRGTEVGAGQRHQLSRPADP